MADNIHFIVGMSRAGTTWLAKSLNTHPRISTIWETGFFGSYYVEPGDTTKYSRSEKERANRLIRVVPGSVRNGPAEQQTGGTYQFLDASSYSKEIESALAKSQPASPREAFLCIANSVRKIERTELFIEKTPHHINWIPRIRTCFPNAKFIVMQRDPYEFMLSYKHQGDRKEVETRKDFKRIYHPLGCAIVCRGYLKSFQRANVILGLDALALNLSTDNRDGQSIIDSCCDFLGIERGVCEIRRMNSSFPEGDVPDLSAADIFWMNMVAGSSMKKLGFTRRKYVLAVGDICQSFAVLPIWAFTTILFLSRKKSYGFKYVLNWLFPGR